MHWLLWSRCTGWLVMAGWLGCALPAVADEAADAAIKAAYLHNFTKFVEWPSLNDDIVHICVVGAEPVVNQLAELASRDLKGHGLQIWSGMDDPQVCQILYIGQGVENWPGLMNQVRGNAVLTVSEVESFASRGGGIGFYREGGQIKLEINPDALQNAHLRANALLFEIARIAR